MSFIRLSTKLSKHTLGGVFFLYMYDGVYETNMGIYAREKKSKAKKNELDI